MIMNTQQHKNMIEEKNSEISDLDYWKTRCQLAEKCLDETPCDPDITYEQMKAWDAYHEFISSWTGSDR